MKTSLRKAILDSSDAAALIPEDLDPILFEELLNLQPLAELLSVAQADGKTHEYSIRSSHPQAWFEGESTPMNQTKSAYVRKTVQLKIQRIWGGVTGFTQAVTEEFIDALETELMGSLTGMADIMEFGALYGAADDIGFTGDAYQYSGILPRMWAYAPGNVVDAGGNKITLDDLDAAIALAAKHRQTRNDPYLWMMGQRMKQVVDGLQTRVQMPLQSMELFDGKLTMAAYDAKPILETDYLVPESTSTSPSDLSATEDDGAGSLAADQYFYNISSVTVYGEQIAGTEANVTMTGGSDAVDLAWTADSNAVLYLIWRGLATGNANLQLLDIIPALSYDSAGTVNGTVTAYKDTGAKTPVAVKPLSTGEQTILLLNRDARKGVKFLGKIDDMGRQVDSLVSYVPLARVKDTYDYMLKAYMSLKMPYPNLVAQIRHAKLA